MSKYTTVFAAKIKAITQPDDEVKKETKASIKEATASLKNLRVLANDLKPEDDPDLLYVVANLAVAGKVNLNDDAMTTKDALATYRKFEKKFVDIEHNRSHVCGYIIKAGLSEFGTDRVLTEEEAATLPYFNITTVSVLWRTVNRPLCDLIVEASNPESAIYKDISLSFEVGFDDYQIGVNPADSRDLATAFKIVSGGEEFETLDKRLRANEGSGITEDTGGMVYRILGGEIIPLGQGIVTVPAAEVKGLELVKPEPVIDTANSQPVVDAKVEAKAEVVASAVQEKSIKTPELSVSSINTNKTMKFNTLEDIEKNWSEIIKPEVAADVSFANARDLFTATIIAESKRLAEEAKIEKQVAAQAKKDAEDSAAAHQEARKLLAEVKAELDEFKRRQAEQAAQAAFDARMGAVMSKFDFSDAERAIVVAKIRNLNDEEYKVWSAEADVLYKDKTKAAKEAAQANLRSLIKEGLEKAGVKTVLADTEVNFAEIFASVKVEDSAIHNRVDTSSSAPMKDLLTKAFGNVSFVKEKKK